MTSLQPLTSKTKKQVEMARHSVPSCNHEYTDSLCRLSEVLLAFASGVLTMVTFGTPYWLEKDPNAGDVEDHPYHVGLWQNCTVMESCRRLPMKGPSVPAYLLLTRIFMFLALAAGVCAWVVCILALIQRKARWLFSSAIVYVLQAFALLLGLSIFSRAYHDLEGTHSSWSYTVGWIAFLFSLVCSAYFILIAVYLMRSSGPDKTHRGSLAQQNAYTPLAQFEESSGSSSEEDAKL